MHISTCGRFAAHEVLNETRLTNSEILQRYFRTQAAILDCQVGNHDGQAKQSMGLFAMRACKINLNARFSNKPQYPQISCLRQTGWRELAAHYAT